MAKGGFPLGLSLGEYDFKNQKTTCPEIFQPRPLTVTSTFISWSQSILYDSDRSRLEIGS